MDRTVFSSIGMSKEQLPGTPVLGVSVCQNKGLISCSIKVEEVAQREAKHLVHIAGSRRW